MSFRHLFLHWTYESFPPGRLLRSRYNAFKKLMDLEEQTMNIIAEIEEIDFGRLKADWQRVEKLAENLGFKVREMLEQLQTMNPVKFMDIMDYYSKINFYTKMAVTVPDPEISEPFLYPLKEAEKNRTSCGVPALELCQAAKIKNIPVPESTVFSSSIYNYFAEANDLRRVLNHELSLINPDNMESVEEISEGLISIIEDSHMPELIANEMEIAALEIARGGKSICLTATITPEGSNSALGGFIHKESGIAPSDIVDAWKRAVAAKYSPSCLIKRISGNFADGETPVVAVINAEDGKGFDGELRTIAMAPASTEEYIKENFMSITCRTVPKAKILIDRKHNKMFGRDENFPLSEHSINILGEIGSRLYNELKNEFVINWKTDSRKRISISAIATINENEFNSFDRFSKALPYIARQNFRAAGLESSMPEKSRSMYDLVRFANEKGISEMFSLVSKDGLGLDGSKTLTGF